MTKTYYDNLQVARTASDTVIRAAYKSLAQKYHPDRFDGDPVVADRIMKLLNEAYAVLSDPIRRKEHDRWIEEQQSAKNKTSSVKTEEAIEKYAEQAAQLAAAGRAEKEIVRILSSCGCPAQVARELAAKFNNHDTPPVAATHASTTSPEKKKSIWSRDIIGYLMERPVIVWLISTWYLFCVGPEPNRSIDDFFTLGGFGVFWGLAAGLGAFAWVVWIVWFVISRLDSQELANKRASILSSTMSIVTFALVVGNTVLSKSG